MNKYNFNNDKSTEDVFGFTGGSEVENQEIKYFYIGKEMPIIQYDEEDGYACSFEHGGYTDNPNEDSPLYASKYLADGSEEWYMLRGKELLDNPRMECWEMLDSGAWIGLFKTVEGFAVERKKKETVGRYYNVVNEDGTVTETWEEAFESRYPDCGEYYHTNNLKALCEWMVSCLYLKVDENGKVYPIKIEVKTTASKADTEFFVTKNGIEVYNKVVSDDSISFSDLTSGVYNLIEQTE